MAPATTDIVRLTPSRAEDELAPLAELLMDAVESGASVGFLPPLAKTAAMLYWVDVAAQVSRGSCVLLVAFEHHLVQGTVQLALETVGNGDHRAQLRQLLVHRRARRQGLGTALVRAAESLAQGLGRSLLLLDARKGSEAEKLFHSLGYVRLGKVPGYARTADGSLHGTVFFYRFQTPRVAGG